MSDGPQARGLSRVAVRGAAATFAGQGLRIGIQLVSVAILARLLTPADYGLLAMVVVLVGVGEILRDFGLSSAAVQARTLTNHQRDTLFWINSGIGLGLALVVAAAAGAIAAVYGRPELVPIARALSVTFLLNGIATQYRAGLLRQMLLGRVAAAETTAPAIALAVAVLVALSGGGYWALVAQSITRSIALLVGLMLGARWLPDRPRRGAPMRNLLGFGLRMVGTQLIGYASNNTDTLIIGLRFGPAPLGLYNRAFHLVMNPLNQMRAPTTTVALPILSRLQDDDERFADFVRRGQLALGYGLVSVLAVAVALAVPITDLFLGSRWEAVSPLLQLLAIAGIFQTLSYVGYWVYLARNLTGALLRYTIVTSVIKVVCVAVGSIWGVVGVAAGYALAPAIAWPLSLAWLSRRTSLPIRALTVGALRILAVVSAAAGAAAWTDSLMVAQSSALRLAVGTLAALVASALIGLAVPIVRRDLTSVMEAIRIARRSPK